jgi:hypothetical protein
MNKDSREMASAMREEQEARFNSLYKVMEEEIELPSGGIFYPNNASTVKIRPMSGKEEDILSNTRLIKTGKVFDELMKSCVTDWNGIEMKDLLLGDENTILTALRIISLGDDYTIEKFPCPSCLLRQNLTISLKNDLDYKNLGADPTKVGVNEFEWTSPKGILFKFKLLNKADKHHMEIEAKRKKAAQKESYIEAGVSDSLLQSILAINEFASALEIQELIKTRIPSEELRDLNNYIRSITPDYDMAYSFECPSCEEVSDVLIPHTMGFFWPDRKLNRE